MPYHTSKRRSHDGVVERLLRQADARPCGKKRLILLQRAVACDVVLTPGDFSLCAALIEVRLRQQLAIEEHLGALEISFCKCEAGARVGDFGHAVDLELCPVGQSEPADDLRGVGVGLGDLRLHFSRGDSNEPIALADARAAFNRSGNHAALYFGSDFGFFLSRQRAGHFEESPNRSLDGGSRADRQRRGRGSRRCRFAFDARSAAGHGRDEDGQEQVKRSAHCVVDPLARLSDFGMRWRLGRSCARRRTGAETGNRRVYRIEDEAVRIVMCESFRETKRSDAHDRRPQQPERDVGVYCGREDARIDAALHLRVKAALQIGHERKSFGTRGQSGARDDRETPERNIAAGPC